MPVSMNSNDFIHEMSPSNAFSDVDDASATFYSIEPNSDRKNQQTTVASTPLNVVEVSLSRSRLMSPPMTKSFSATAGNQRRRMVDLRSSPLEQQLPRELKVKWAGEAARDPKTSTFEHIKKHSHHSRDADISGTSADDSSSEKPMSPTEKDIYLELEALVCNPNALDDQWKCVVQNGDNITNLAQILAWYSSAFSKIYNNGISVCKAFQIVASDIGGDSHHLIPRRAFKRLLMAIICINRSLKIFSSIDPGSCGYAFCFRIVVHPLIFLFCCRNPRINFEMFCTCVAKLGSKMDRKRCLFEYQSIKSRTKGHLHIDEFNLWLIKSKVLKLQQEIDRPGSARNNRFSNLAVGAEQSQTFQYQRRTSQVSNAVISCVKELLMST